jgi:hypothetical protein
MKSKLKTRDDFDYWVFDMDDVLDLFMKDAEEKWNLKLDYSPESLTAIEKMILANYASLNDFETELGVKVLDNVARYVGEVFRKHLGGYWSIRLDDEKFAFYGMPILIDIPNNPTSVCPLALTTASTFRRTGSFLFTVFNNIKKNQGR